MPGVATGTDATGRKSRKTPIEHAGEVTRQKKVLELQDADDLESPPVFDGPKLRSRIDRKQQDVTSSTSRPDEDSKIWADIGGARFESAARNSQEAKSRIDSLAAPPGWRRFWARAAHIRKQGYDKLDDVVISNFCRCCLEKDTSCRMESYDVYCRACGASGQEQCVRVVSYKTQPYEDMDINRIPTYNGRTLAREWQAKQGTPDAIASGQTAKQRQVLNSVPPSLAKEVATRNLESKGSWPNGDSLNKHKPTYSKVRDSYHALAELRYHDQCFRLESANRSRKEVWPAHISRFMDVDARFDTHPAPNEYAYVRQELGLRGYTSPNLVEDSEDTAGTDTILEGERQSEVFGSH